LAVSHKSNEVFQHLIENYDLYFEKSLHATAASGNVARMREQIEKDGLGVMVRLVSLRVHCQLTCPQGSR
jgi:hypothetical protein